jgi:murein DD-endopeptidase MepM/ murein hydrolase activator NlpD
MIRVFFTLILASFLSFSMFSQEKPKEKYHSPLGIPLVLAANFGELRPNHFHMGVDFKTNGIEGLPLYSIEDGFVSRIKMSPYGYGKVVYIDHPNGITSVYAHCSILKGKLDSIVKQIQEKEQNFEVDIYFSPSDITLKKGQIIALSGNTGSSTAPHLHFELRDTKTEIALNPLLYGFSISDHKSPEIKGIKVYALTEKGYQIPGKSKTINVTKSNSKYSIPANLLNVPADYCTMHGGIGFSFNVVDYLDASMNVCGLYGSSLKNENDTVFCQKIDQVSFDHSRYVNSHKDFNEYNLSKQKYHKSFKTAHNPLSIYPQKSLGIINAEPGDSLSLKYSVFDVNGNNSVLDFSVKILKGEMNSQKTIFPSWKYFLPDSAYHYKNEFIEFSAEPLTFYEPTLKNISLKEPFSFGDSKQPIQQPINVKIKLPTLIEDRSKYFISVTSYSGKPKALASKIIGNWIEASSMDLGSFKIKTDTLAPIITPLNFTGNETIINKTRLSWKVLENQTALIDYDLFIDGKWFLLEFESKGTYLFFDRPKNFTGKHFLELKAKDSCGNVRIWSKELNF